jgi:nitrogen regulatory protein PII
MKLLLIVAVKAFQKEIQQLLKKANISSYSYKEVTGYQNSSEELIEENWFATNSIENESVLFYVFAHEKKVDPLFENVAAFNAKQESLSQIHLAVLCIEKSN